MSVQLPSQHCIWFNLTWTNKFQVAVGIPLQSCHMQTGPGDKRQLMDVFMWHFYKNLHWLDDKQAFSIS